MKFAKLFEVDNTQVLYQVVESTDEDDASVAMLEVCTDINGGRVTVRFGYPSWDMAETKLAMATQVDAAAFYANAKDMTKELL